MPSKEFIVKLTTSEFNEWALELDQVQPLFTDTIGYRGTVYVDSVVEFRREDYTFNRYGKIQAIKQVRSLINCSLLEAKTLVDGAERRGTGLFSAFGVTIDYDSVAEPSAYHVSASR